ncbi:MAG: PAS domain S-box protein [Myxococcota bacterium]|nr:PAS domain S-box protein [Myxococcota bacterium]
MEIIYEAKSIMEFDELKRDIFKALERAQGNRKNLDESLTEFLGTLKTLLSVEIILAYVVPPGIRELQRARVVAVAGASLKREEYSFLPPALAEALMQSADTPVHIDETGLSMKDILPVLANRVFKGVAVTMQVGKWVNGALFIAGDNLELSDSLNEVLRSVARRLAVAINHRTAYELLATSRLITAVEYAGEAIQITDADGFIEYINPAFETITGFTALDVIGHRYTEFVRMEGEDKLTFADLRAALEFNKVWRGKLVGFRKGGALWYQGATVCPVLNEAHDATHFVFILRNISSRIEAEQAVRHRERSLSATFNALGAAVVVTDRVGNIRRMNPAAEVLTEWNSTQAVGRPISRILEMIEADSRKSIAIEWEMLFKEVQEIEFDVSGVLVGKEGGETPLFIHTSPILDADEGLLGIVFIGYDLSKQQATMQVLQDSEKNFAEVIERNPDGVVITKNGMITFANRAFARTLGYEVAQLVGQTLEQYVLEEDMARFVQWFSDDSETLYEIRFIGFDGARVNFECSQPREVNFRGQTSMIHMFRDVTARREMENQLMLADRMVSVGTMAAGVAHEVNNPLAYLAANLKFLDEYMPLIKQKLSGEAYSSIAQALAEAQDGAERVEGIVRDLKLFARGHQDEFEVIDLQRCIEAAIKMAWNEVRHRGRLVKQFGAPVKVRGNHGKLVQVFLNLILNAAHALPTGEARANLIKISLVRKESGMVSIDVFDTGCGIPQSKLDRIFDPFYTTKEIGKGTGLGLSICHNILSSMGGTISAESLERQWTKIHIELPLVLSIVDDGSTAHLIMLPNSEALPEEAEDQSKLRILIVDDEPVVAKALKRALRKHDVEVVGSGKQAIEKWFENEYDIMFCDVMMPGLMGYDVYQAIKDKLPGDESRLLFMTGGAFTQESEKFLGSLDEHQIIQKPFDFGLIENYLAQIQVSRLKKDAVKDSH